jgi:hypothetical protein
MRQADPVKDSEAALRLLQLAADIGELKRQIQTLTAERDVLIRQLRDAGLTLREIALLADISHVTVREIADETSRVAV